MAFDLVGGARSVVAALERGDGPTVQAASRFPEWAADEWIVQRWRPRLEELAGPERRVSTSRLVNDRMVRVMLDGARGRAYVSLLFDEAGKLAGVGIDEDESDGRFAIVIGCTRSGTTPLTGDERRNQFERLRAFYTMLVSGPLGFGEGGGPAPRWRDPEYPMQMHLDIQVADLREAEAAVLAQGAKKLEDCGEWRVYGDPAGHPFYLYPGLSEPADRLGRLLRVVIDCPDPGVMAQFWGGLLDMPMRVEDSSDRIVIAGEDDDRPMIGLQRVADYRPPRWPDPDYPAQMHFDIGFDDRASRERLALKLGAAKLPPQGGSCPVYADPAGHPFCLCYKGE